MANNYFKSIKLERWQQFDKIDIDFDNQVTIITGPNGCGKTTILSILARHAGWVTTSYRTPVIEAMSGIFRYIIKLVSEKEDSVGKLEYGNKSVSKITVPDSNSAQYHLDIQNQQGVECFYIPSHRNIPNYQPISAIPTHRRTKNDAFNEVISASMNRYLHGGGASSFYIIKETLLGWLIQGYGVKVQNNVIYEENRELIENYEGFVSVLRIILPKTFGFERIEIRKFELVFVCNQGKDEFLLETASGGIAALIDIAWQIYMFSTEEKEAFTVIIDEIENHLHPSMQRRILGDLAKAFPRAKFIVSTHSPLVVGSVKNSNVYALRKLDTNGFISQKLDLQDKAKTASEILDEVLGVSFSMPLWAEQDLQLITNKYLSKPMSEQDFHDMRDELSAIGLEKLLPEAINQIITKKK